jgi:type II secretory pathway pseudopilin PulG
VRVANQFRRQPTAESGFVLMVILLMLALLIIGLVAIAPREAAQIRRDREEETIHRGTEYARAVKRFYKKVGRYPVRIEELENTNNMRFLRKRYTDPMTGQEFRILHYGEQKSVPKGLFGAPAGAAAGVGGAGAGGFSAGGGGGLPGAIIGNAMGGSPIGGNQVGGSQTSGSMGAPTFGGTAPGSGDNSGQPQTSGPQAGGTPAASLGSGPTFGGAPIIGVAGTKDQSSIKAWNDKTNYRDWEFYYDPRFDVQQGVPGGVGQPVNPASGTNPQGQGPQGPK